MPERAYRFSLAPVTGAAGRRRNATYHDVKDPRHTHDPPDGSAVALRGTLVHGWRTWQLHDIAGPVLGMGYWREGAG